MFLTDLARKLRQSKFIDLGLCKNQWLWFHIFAGLFVANLLLYFDVNSILFLFGHLSVKIATLINVFLIAVIWEFIEFYIESGYETSYGTVEKWFWDSVGDVFGATFITLINIIFIHFYFVAYY